MGVPRVVSIFHFVFQVEGATLIGPSPSFLELWAIPKKTPLWTSPKIEVQWLLFGLFPLYKLYTCKLNNAPNNMKYLWHGLKSMHALLSQFYAHNPS
jgi:hypothetical protein